MAIEYKLSYTGSQINAKLGKIDSLAEKSELPTKTSDLTNDSGFVTESYVNTAVSNIDIPDEIYVNNEAPTDAKEGALWLDLDEEAFVSGSGSSGSSQNGNGLTTAQINALDGLFKAAAYIKADVSAEYNAFKNAFGISDSGSGGEEEPDEPVIPDEPDEPDVPEKTLTSISATYSGGNVAVGTAVNSLSGIVVTAHYSDGTNEAVTGYTMSGTIAEGSNTITVTYQGKTTAFTVNGIVAESTAVNLMTTGELGTFADLGTYTGYTGHYNADSKTLQLTAKSNSTNPNAHLKITPFVEKGKTYTLFLGNENRTSNGMKVDYSTTASFATKNLSNTFDRQPYSYAQFTVPEDMVEIYFAYTTKEHIDTTVTNVALYEGAYTERP